jgi:hypothetical protein
MVFRSLPYRVNRGRIPVPARVGALGALLSPRPHGLGSLSRWAVGQLAGRLGHPCSHRLASPATTFVTGLGLTRDRPAVAGPTAAESPPQVLAHLRPHQATALLGPAAPKSPQAPRHPATWSGPQLASGPRHPAQAAGRQNHRQGVLADYTFISY